MSGGYSSGKIAIAVCGRCSVKMPYTELRSDGNIKSLKVCAECRDDIDPYKLAPRQPDVFVLKNPRPDLPLDGLPNYLLDDYGLPIYGIDGEPILR